ncbi:hypothetical protein BST85_02330 [Aureitalea marina]|uniref:Uncharacterized protein n=1 Tax=Aureitalea marina TaxID=930804 RepID=A0A2S7KTS1_9FLAO|nr:hypothetical protein BST85_02330 [Aureitalea marina]
MYRKGRQARPFKVFKDSLTDLYRSRFLARQWATRDIKGQYRQSILGILWLFITPLMTALVWIVLNSSGTVKLSDTGIPYPIYAFSGTLIWSIIVQSINAPTLNTSAAKSVLSKINFPKEALLLSGFYKLLFNSFPKVLLLIIFLFVFDVGYHHSLLLLIPVLLSAIFFGFTIGVLLTPIALLYKDIGRLVATGLRFLMYVTPVVYAIPESGMLRTVMQYNPFTPFILTARDVATETSPENLEYFFTVLVLCMPLAFVGLVVYRISIPILVERMNA